MMMKQERKPTPRPGEVSEGVCIGQHPTCYFDSTHKILVKSSILAQYALNKNEEHLSGATAIIKDMYGEYLILEHAKSGKWSIAGGKVEEGETPREAIIREIKEELGVDACDVEILDEFGPFLGEHGYHYPFYVRLKAQWRNMEPEKHPNIGYVKRNKIEDGYLTESAFFAIHALEIREKLACQTRY